MTARKNWSDLAPRTREARFSAIAANHLPTPKNIFTMAAKHARCADGANCTGPGCRVR